MQTHCPRCNAVLPDNDDAHAQRHLDHCGRPSSLTAVDIGDLTELGLRVTLARAFLVDGETEKTRESLDEAVAVLERMGFILRGLKSGKAGHDDAPGEDLSRPRDEDG